MKENLQLLYSVAEIAKKVKILAAEIQNELPRCEDFVCVCVLKGAFLFFSDLVRHFDSRAICAFTRVSSYGDETKSSGTVRMPMQCTEDVTDKHVLIVDDIADSGLSLSFLTKYFADKGAASVRTAVLIDRPNSRTNGFTPNFAAFTLTDRRFVVGYGLDDKQRYRNLPGIYVVDN